MWPLKCNTAIAQSFRIFGTNFFSNMPAFIAPANCRYDYEYDWICIWDCIKNLCHLNWPEIMLSIFKHAHRFLRWWALCTKHVNFPAFCGCESILGRKSTHIILSFHVPFMFLSFCIHFLSCSFHVPFLLHSFPFMFRRYVSNIQVFERWYAQTGQVGIRPNACIFFILSFCHRFGGLCRLPSSGFMNCPI